MGKSYKDSASYRVMKSNRKTWHISPVEKVVPSKKKYNRKELKDETRKVVNGQLKYDYFDGTDGDVDGEWIPDDFIG
jgi:hypothetical protein